jgi:hypothetical protein
MVEAANRQFRTVSAQTGIQKEAAMSDDDFATGTRVLTARAESASDFPLTRFPKSPDAVAATLV